MQKIAAVLISLALRGHALAAEPLKMGVVVKVGGRLALRASRPNPE